MQTVVSPRLDPASAETHPSLPRFLPAGAILATAAIVLLLLSWLERPRGFLADHWYAVSSVEGVPSYTPYANEAACRDVESVGEVVCVSGADLNR